VDVKKEWRNIIEVRENPNIAPFKVGDTVRVFTKVIEGDRQRSQVFEGVVLRRRNSGPASNFTVRRVAYGVGVERTFPLYSPLLEKVEVVRSGQVRRAKLYYLRGLSAKEARAKTRAKTSSPS